MENLNETPNEIQAAERLIDLSLKFDPPIDFELDTAQNHPILYYDLNDSSISKLSQFLDFYFPDVEKIPITDEGYELLRGGEHRRLSREGIDPNIYEVKFTDGTKIFIAPKSAKKDIEAQGGIRKRSDKIASFVGQDAIGDILTGDAKNILPVVSGEKPAAYIGFVNAWPKSMARMPVIQELLKNCPQLSMMQERDGEEILLESQGVRYVATKYGFVFYNRNTVRQIVAQNPDIFDKIGVNSGMTAEEIIKIVLLRETATDYKEAGTDMDIALGILLGFDRQSVLNYGEERTEQPTVGISIWDGGYTVHDHKNNKDYQRLKARYDELQAKIEHLLEQGLDSMQVLIAISKS